MNVCANVKHLTMEPIPSSTGRASIWRSTGRVSMVVGWFAPVFRVDLPFRKRRNDSRNVFLKDFLLDKASPAPVKSENENRIDQSIYRKKKDILCNSILTIWIQSAIMHDRIVAQVIEKHQAMSRSSSNQVPTRLQCQASYGGRW